MIQFSEAIKTTIVEHKGELFLIAWEDHVT